MKKCFREMIEAQWAHSKSVCVGLDPDYDKIPECVKARARRGTAAGYSSAGKTLVDFCISIVAATKDLVCAYKPNAAFFEAMSAEGTYALGEIVRYINQVAPEVPVIYDAKRADIGNTNAGYVRSAFDFVGADAITVHSYLGKEALRPFLDLKDKGIIVLCRTSNPGAGEFQDRYTEIDAVELAILKDLGLEHLVKKVSFISEDGPASFSTSGFLIRSYQLTALRVAHYWHRHGANCAVVVGATYPEELKTVREIVTDMPILIPGIGAQGGDVEKTVKAGRRADGQGMIINSSRGIIFASNGEDFAEAARNETIKLQETINQFR